jgi:hypothetical protein
MIHSYTIKEPGRHRIDIPYPPNWRSYGITNVKITGPAWSSLTLEIGRGYAYETIVPEMCRSHLCLTAEGQTLPFAGFHPFSLVVDGSDAIVTYEIKPLRLHPPSHFRVNLPFIIKETRIPVSTFLKQLTIQTEKGVTDVRIDVPLQFTCHSDPSAGSWVFDFADNSDQDPDPVPKRVDLTIQIDGGSPIFMWGIERNVMRYVSDMYGLAFNFR